MTPDYHHLIEPILTILDQSIRFVRFTELRQSVAEMLDLSRQEVQAKLPSGRQTVFENKLAWALNYLEGDLFIETDGANGWRITANGKAAFEQGNLHLNYANGKDGAEIINLKRPIEIKTTGKEQSGTSDYLKSGPGGSATGPNKKDDIAQVFEEHYQSLKKDLIMAIHSQSPAFFENLIIDLLLAMGYGDRRRDLARHLGASGDGGIDGVINQDQLGLDVVYIQAKRYRPDLPVPVSAIRDFAGALKAHKANKGVFVTTSRFTRDAGKFVEAVSMRIVLIDGEKLTSLLIRNNIGVDVVETWELKQLDEEYYA